jgi:Zn-dependent alcohol dehydrogenase
MKAPVLFEQRAPLRVEELEDYLAGKLHLDDLITRGYSIDEADQAFRDLAAGALARGLIVF